MSGDHTKALIGQLIIFNQILGELREDIREQVRDGERMRGGIGPGGDWIRGTGTEGERGLKERGNKQKCAGSTIVCSHKQQRNCLRDGSVL